MSTGIADLPQAVQGFLNTPRYGVLATLRPDGSPHQTVMWWKRQDGRIMMNTLSGRAKDRYLARDGRASLCIEDGQYYVAIDGMIEVDRDSNLGQQTIRELTAHYEGEASAEQRMRDDFSGQDRITLYLTPSRIDARGFDE